MGLDFLLTPSPVPPSPSNSMSCSMQSHLGLLPLLSSTKPSQLDSITPIL